MREKINLILIAVMLSSFNFVYSQHIIKATVTDSLNIPLPYVNIGIYNKQIGTVTSSKGIFSITNIDDSMLNDSLIFSFIGYETKKILVKNLVNKKEARIILKNKIQELDEVLVVANSTKDYSKGRSKSKSAYSIFFATPESNYSYLGTEIGRKFSVGSKKLSLLKEFKFFINRNNFDNAKFRLTIYSIKNKIPNAIINSENIYMECVNNYTGWLTVDLTKYNLYVNQDIIITVAFVEGSEKGDELSLPLLVSPRSIHYFRYRPESNWYKYKMISTTMILKYNQ
jgi:hypothetical protein